MKKDIPLFDVTDQEQGTVQAEPVEFVNLYEKREKIYTRKVSGYFNNLRRFTGWILLLPYFLLPWINWDGQQSILFDLPARKFHILGLTFWPKDLFLLACLLMIAAFALFFFTNLAGRVWCGYVCPQTVWTKIFMFLERVAEGDRNQRMKLDAAPASAGKFARKGFKHLLWLMVGLITGLTFVGYFTPMRELIVDLALGKAHSWAYFWVGFFTLATYGNAGWLREQVCIYMCPYARFQSAMFDRDTLVVLYDEERGEPRGSRRKSADHRAEGLGDCINCQLCVHVCPVGIDIRDGLQYECITCAACVDACNSVMDKMGYERGLVRYTTENNLAGGQSRIMRPRLLGYGAMLAIMIAAFGFTILTRVPLELNIIRERGQLFSTTAQGLIENSYELHLMNMTDTDRSYRIYLESPVESMHISRGDTMNVAAGEFGTGYLTITARPEDLTRISLPIHFRVEALDDAGIQVQEESRFMGPPPTR